MYGKWGCKRMQVMMQIPAGGEKFLVTPTVELVSSAVPRAECIAPGSPSNGGPSVAEFEKAVVQPSRLSLRTQLAGCGRRQDLHCRLHVGTPF